MPSIDALAAAVAAMREQLRSISASLTDAHQKGEDLAGAFEQLGAEGRARSTRSVVEAIEHQQTAAAGLDTVAEQIQGAVEALRGAGGGGGGGIPPGRPPTPAPPPEPDPAEGSGGEATPAPAITRPRFAPDPARRPRGEPAVIEGSAGKQEDLRKENESATVLARAGYDIEQNPPARPNGREPDYRMRGEYWDCYAPSGGNLRTVETALRRKVGKTEAKCQADRIILNLDDFDLEPTAIRGHLERFPIRRLKEIKIVKHGTVTQFYPWDSEVDPHGD